MSVRVRVAPSPTGAPHLGILRTALFDFLYARHTGGTMILRIEDTDRSRFVPGCEEEIMASLRWLGIEWDEGPDIGGPFGPYRQSERKEAGIYAVWIQKLIDGGYAYWAFDTPEELEEMREYQQVNRQPVGYFGGTWRDASASQVEAAQAAGKPGVVRLKMPRGRTLVCNDLVRGRVEFDSDTIDDPVLIKADGMPTYHFAAMVDDHLMEITHIIRGVEWISSAPKHVWLFEAFGWTPPQFIHVQVINGPDGKKLSKRHGDTRVFDFRNAGYLPEALANFVALIGWAPGGDREIMSMCELIEAFELDGLQPSPGVFDIEKLRWMNGHYLRQFSGRDLREKIGEYAGNPEVQAFWARDEHATLATGKSLAALAGVLDRDPALVEDGLVLVRERVVTLADFGEACDFVIADRPVMDPAAVGKWFTVPHARDLFASICAALASSDGPISVEESESLVRGYAEAHGLDKLGPVVHPVRVALTGRTVGPGLFELMSVLGRHRMIERFENALRLLP